MISDVQQLQVAIGSSVAMGTVAEGKFKCGFTVINEIF